MSKVSQYLEHRQRGSERESPEDREQRLAAEANVLGSLSTAAHFSVAEIRYPPFRAWFERAKAELPAIQRAAKGKESGRLSMLARA